MCKNLLNTYPYAAMCTDISTIYDEAVLAHATLNTIHGNLQEQCNKIGDILDLCTKVSQINTVFSTADTVIKPLANLVPGLLGSLVKVVVKVCSLVVQFCAFQ